MATSAATGGAGVGLAVGIGVGVGLGVGVGIAVGDATARGDAVGSGEASTPAKLVPMPELPTTRPTRTRQAASTIHRGCNRLQNLVNLPRTIDNLPTLVPLGACDVRVSVGNCRDGVRACGGAG
jgi:hypothetical protein